MTDAIIVVNAGSSSLKFSVYEVGSSQLNVITRGQIDGLGTAPHFKAKDASNNTLADTAIEGSAKSFGHREAFAHISEWLRAHFAAQYTVIGIGHRIVHGGSDFFAPTLLTPEVLTQLESLIPLAPLHEPHNLAAIKAVAQSHPNLPQVGCFDTAFHHSRETVTLRFGLPDELFQQNIRRWGFHGISYESIAAHLRKEMPQLAAGRVIVAHLGSGASLCAMRDGRSVDTTMSFSVLDGLPMGTRCGSLDPGVVLHLLRQGMTAAQIEDLLYKRSGLLGISGVSNDVRNLLASSSPLAAEAIDYFVYHVARQIGSLTVALGGLDSLIFTAGIGENSPVIRERICQHLKCLNIEIDPAANSRGEKLISPASRSPSVRVIPTDEEGMMAIHTLSIIRPQSRQN